MDLQLKPTANLNLYSKPAKASHCHHPSFKGVVVPADKSISHRSIMLASLARGTSLIKNLLLGEDCLATLSAFEQMGVKTRWFDDDEQDPNLYHSKVLEVVSPGYHALCQNALNQKFELDFGNSGTAIRLMMGVLAGLGVEACLTGDESIQKRPMNRVAEPLAQMGANITLNQGNYPPIHLKPSKIEGCYHQLKVASAQVQSALLLAGLFAQSSPTQVCSSTQTRNHTENIFKSFGIDIKTYKRKQQGGDDWYCSEVAPLGQKEIRPQNLTIGGDISSAAFIIVAVLLSYLNHSNSLNSLNSSQVKGLWIRQAGINPTRCAFMTILRKMGARIQTLNEPFLALEKVADLWVEPSKLSPLWLDSGDTDHRNTIANAIDEIPLLLILCAFVQGQSVIKGASELRVKESDRLQSVSENFKTLGIAHQNLDDGMVIFGQTNPLSHLQEKVELASFKDHRIAMGFSLLSLKSPVDLRIKDCEAIATSFPNFKACLQELGFDIEEVED